MECYVEKLIKEKLDINIEYGGVQRAHRVNRRLPGNENDRSKPRAIIAYFLKYSDKEKVRVAATKKKPKFGESPLFISEDFTVSVMARRRKLVPLMKEKREAGLRAWLSYDKLRYIQDGNLKTIHADAPVTLSLENDVGERSSTP